MALTSSGQVIFIDAPSIKVSGSEQTGEIPRVYSYDSIVMSIESNPRSESNDDVCPNVDCMIMGTCMKTESGAPMCFCAQGASRQDGEGRLDAPCMEST